MKPAFKKSFIFILAFVVFLAITQWILWSYVFGKNNASENKSPTYNTLEEYIKEKANTDCTYEVLAKNDAYALIFVNDIEHSEYKILSKKEDGKWLELNIFSECEIEAYSNINANIDFNYLYFFKIKNSNTKIIIVKKYTMIKEYEGNVSNEGDNKIYDTVKTKFYYTSKYDKVYLDVYCAGIVNNFNEKDYKIYINDNECPYNKWNELFIKLN